MRCLLVHSSLILFVVGLNNFPILKRKEPCSTITRSSYISSTFTYNENGYRTSKTEDGITTRYFYDGTKLVGEETNGNITLYIYDSQNSPIGMMYYDFEDRIGWSTYWYEKTLMGDIVAVYDEAGTLLITYRYTVYGDWYRTSHNGGYNTPAYDNPFLFRGY